jgi:hypothetical protein
MKKKIIYSFILIFSISLISSAKKIPGCSAATCCKMIRQNSNEKKVNIESKQEAASLSLFFFNI